MAGVNVCDACSACVGCVSQLWVVILLICIGCSCVVGRPWPHPRPLTVAVCVLSACYDISYQCYRYRARWFLLVKDFSPELNFEILNFVQCVPWPTVTGLAGAKTWDHGAPSRNYPLCCDG